MAIPRMPILFPLIMPYYQPAEDLPLPLPSVEEIRASQLFFGTRRDDRHIVHVGDHFIVKYGSNVDLIKGENMLFVRQSCNVPVAELYALFHDEATQSDYIIMQFIPGESLASLWESLDDVSKGAITQELRKTFNELRQIPHHDYYGRLGSRAYFDQLFMTLEPERYQGVCGPFTTEDELFDAIAYRYKCEYLFPHRGEYLRRILPQVLHSDRPFFTHGDLQRKNVIVSADNIPFVIDWEAAGFYPEDYDYYTAMVAFGHYKDDWYVWVGRVLDEYVVELGWLDTIRRELDY